MGYACDFYDIANFQPRIGQVLSSTINLLTQLAQDLTVFIWRMVIGGSSIAVHTKRREIKSHGIIETRSLI